MLHFCYKRLKWEVIFLFISIYNEWNPKMFECNWTWLLYKCVYAATRCFFTFPISKEKEHLKNILKKDEYGFSSYTKHYQKISSRRWWQLGLGLVKNVTFSYRRADFSVIVNISVKTLRRHAIHTIFEFFIFSISFKS